MTEKKRFLERNPSSFDNKGISIYSMRKSNNFVGPSVNKHQRERNEFLESPTIPKQNPLISELDSLKESILNQQNSFQKQITKSKIDSALSLQSKRKSNSKLKALKEVSSRNKMMEAFLEIEKIQEFSRTQIESTRKNPEKPGTKKPKKLQKLPVKKRPDSFSSSNMVPLENFKGKGKFDSNDFLTKKKIEEDRYEAEEKRITSTRDMIKNVADKIIESKDRIDTLIDTNESKKSLNTSRRLSKLHTENSVERVKKEKERKEQALNFSRDSSIDNNISIENQDEDKKDEVEFEGLYKVNTERKSSNPSVQNLKNLISNQTKEPTEDEIRKIRENEMKFRKKLSISRRTNSKDYSGEEDLTKLDKMLTQYRSYKNSDNP